MKTIGVFFGSRTPEHDISIITGQLVISGLKKLGYPVVPVYIDKQGRWLIGSEMGELKSFTGNKINFDNFKEYYIDLESSVGKLVFKQKGMMGKTLTVDLAFPALHGSNGEDGTIQGLFEMFNVPYVGCDVACSAITMNKVLTLKMLKAAGVPTVEFRNYKLAQWQKDKAAILAELEKAIGFPMIVKPPLLGSSIGIVKVSESKGLEQAIETAFYYGNEVLVEDCVENLMDLTCSVIGNEQPQASLIQQSVVTDEVLTFSDKYLSEGGTQTGNSQKSVVIPAPLSEDITSKIRNTAVEVFATLGCSGISRVDFLYDQKAGKFFVSEVNTLPGTLYHHLWSKTGIELPELIQKLMALAEERFAEKQRYATVFESDLLRMAGSIKLQNKLVSKP